MATLQDHIERRNAQLRQHNPGLFDAEHYLAVLQDRADRFAAHVASMSLSPAVVQWALAMEQRYGPYVLAHHYVADWITALLILRYGEEPDASKSTDPNFAGWPTTFTAEDLARAADLLAGTRWPTGVLRLLPTEG
jgi:hypothetical protein